MPPVLMTGKHSVHQTQWAAQFAVASELCKRSYQVALTMGNHPEVDLMAISQKGTQFIIDVKGLYKKNFWVIKANPERKHFYYVLAFVPEDKPNRYFVLTQQEVNEELNTHLTRIRKNREKKGLSTAKVGVFSGVLWTFAERFEDRWDMLPK